MLWDLQEKTSKHVFIPLLNISVRILAYNNKYTFPKIIKGQKITFVELWHKKCKSKDVDKLVDKIKKAYSRIGKIVDGNSYDISPSEVIKSFLQFVFSSSKKKLNFILVYYNYPME
jgi:hypothetical protein